MVILVCLAVIIAIIAVISAAGKADVQAYETRVREVMQAEANHTQFLCKYLDALKLLDSILKAHRIGEVMLSMIFPVVESSTRSNFHIESVIEDDGWLKDHFFTVDAEEYIRDCKKMENDGLTPASVPKWEELRKTGTVWSILTDEEFHAINSWIKKGAKCTTDESNNTVLEQSLVYYCEEREISVYLSAIAQAIREKYPHYNVKTESRFIAILHRQ